VTQSNPLRRKALQCIREGRVAVLWVKASSDEAVTTFARVAPTSVLARVVSSRDRHPYKITFTGDAWLCDCREGQRGLPCAHTLAVALVTTGSTT